MEIGLKSRGDRRRSMLCCLEHKVAVDGPKWVWTSYKVYCINEAKASRVGVHACGVPMPCMSDNTYRSSHSIVALTPGSSVHVGGGKLEDATIGQFLLKDREVDVEYSCREDLIPLLMRQPLAKICLDRKTT
jgi:hypothetical protein